VGIVRVQGGGWCKGGKKERNGKGEWKRGGEGGFVGGNWWAHSGEVKIMTLLVPLGEGKGGHPKEMQLAERGKSN